MGAERAPTAHPVPAMDVVEVPAGQAVTVCGRIDVWSLAPVRDLLQRVIDTGSGDVLLRLGDAEVGDVAALGMLVGAHHRARRAGRRLVISEASPRTARLLRATRLNRVLLGASEPPGTAVAPFTAYQPT
ncbi:MAG: STAS domain-containing protein [Dermatophilaceae bacterium]